MGPYIRMETPMVSCRMHDGSRLTMPEHYMAWQVERLAVKDVARPWLCDLTVLSRIEHGRWCTTCINCGNSAYVQPEWHLACCGECGCQMRHVDVPRDYQKIEVALLERPHRENQNWLPGETLFDILRENKEHL